MSKSILDVDMYSLDKEWAEQANNYHIYAKKVSEARFEYSKKKAMLDLVKAELSLDIRSNPDKYKLPKTTEDTVNAAITVHDKTKVAQQELFDSKKELDDLEAILSALDHKKYALQDMVQLFLSDYFSTPRSKDSVEANEKMKQEKMKERIKKSSLNKEKNKE